MLSVNKHTIQYTTLKTSSSFLCLGEEINEIPVSLYYNGNILSSTNDYSEYFE